MSKARKSDVTTRGVIQRINRKLKPDFEAVRLSPKRRTRAGAKQCYVIDYRDKAVHNDINPESLGRALGVLKDWEKVIDPV